MGSNTLFEILIYSCDRAELTRRILAEIDSCFMSVPGHGDAIWTELRDDEIRRQRKPLQYNEIIGCIQVYSRGSQLRADYSFTDKTRIVIGSKIKGVIRPRGKLLEKHYGHDRRASAEIFNDFRAALRNVIGGRVLLSRRYIDFAAFDRCGPYIDWRSILGLTPRRK